MQKKVLIIEDDSTILYGLKAKFSSVGVSVLANNGVGEINDVIHEIRVNKPEYIILDLILQGFDGFEMLSTIKAEIVDLKISIFIFSNIIDKNSREKCESLGADYYFLKNEFNIDEFVDKVLRIIKNKEKNIA